MPCTTRQYIPKDCNVGSVTWLVNQLICLDFVCNVGELSELEGECSCLSYSHTWQLLSAEHNWVRVLVYLNSLSLLKSQFAWDCVRIYYSIIWQTAWYKKQNVGKYICYWKCSNNHIFAKKWDGLVGPVIWAVFYPAVASADIITGRYWWVLQMLLILLSLFDVLMTTYQHATKYHGWVGSTPFYLWGSTFGSWLGVQLFWGVCFFQGNTGASVRLCHFLQYLFWVIAH